MKAFRVDTAEGGFILRELHPNKDRTKRKMAAAKNNEEVLRVISKWLKRMSNKSQNAGLQRALHGAAGEDSIYFSIQVSTVRNTRSCKLQQELESMQQHTVLQSYYPVDPKKTTQL